jgi:hypothetical protein
MGKRNEISPTRFPAKEQSDVRAFVRKLFEDNCPAEDAVAELRSKFDAEDFVRVRELWGKLSGSASKEARGPRSKN